MSFFSKLSKLPAKSDFDEDFEVEDAEDTFSTDLLDDSENEYAADGELSVDVYRDGNRVIIKAMTPGVKKEDLEIQLSRDSLTVRGIRHDESEVHEDHYHYKELYWGSFSRTVHLPDEVDIDAAEAHEEHGLLTIILPVLDKKRQNKLKIKG